jgi:YHS domain-containing protein
MLLQVLLTDEWEPVRLEAARGLRDMFLNCGCREEDGGCEFKFVTQIHADLDSKGKHVHAVMNEKVKALLKGDVCAVLDPHWIHPLLQHKLHMDRLRGAPDADSGCQCKCCCNAETLNKLAKVAYESKDDGCGFEPSRRVREMAVEAIEACGVPCHYKPYTEGDEYGPPAYEPEPLDGEVLPPVVPEAGEQLPGVGSRLLNLPRSANYTPVPNRRLKKVCLVSLKQGKKVLPTGEFSRAYRGRTYQFASEAALIEFERSPEKYAVAFGGCDPVHFVATRKVIEGRYLIVHGGRFYMFATKKNLALFKAESGRYTVKHEADRHASTENSTLTSEKFKL